MDERLMIGAMSGTSADGVDAALVRISGRGLQMRATLVGHVEHPFPTDFRTRIIALRDAKTVELSDLCRFGIELSDHYASAVHSLLIKTSYGPADICAIAAHGQTLFHAPPLTLQWIDPAHLAQKCRIDVISDFRRADCAIGGQGAPLVPFADYILFRSESENRVILNLGGIANVTILRARGSLDEVVGFDTGPGNCLSDWLMRDHGGVDRDGQLALSGNSIPTLIDAYQRQPYFRQPPPKSTDVPQMLGYFPTNTTQPLPDLLASSAAIVGNLVHDAIRSTTGWSRSDYTLIAAGGGVRNRAIANQLGHPRTTDDFGIPAQAREAVAFALLGAATLDRTPANIPSVTGARGRTVLGAITPGRTS